ncbi:MAG TPA: hypothetical protein VHX38_27670 [Pseudonocardiaceae bacterium]|jgi:hypothetical protein|nr:hypothetical protein [Pseudonocardiaceae bacterium]
MGTLVGVAPGAGRARKPGRAFARLRTTCWALAVLVFLGGGITFLVSFGNADADYGSMRIPGSQVIQLPAGQVDMTYTMDLDNQTVDIPVLGITVTSEHGGAKLAVTNDIENPIGINGVTHDVVAWATVPSAGSYRVTVDGGDSWAPNPQLTFGPPSISSYLGFGTLGVTALLVIIGFLAHAAVRRARRRAGLLGAPVADTQPDVS